MNDYNYQRMIEEILEEYESRLEQSPEEQQILTERITNMHRNARLIGDMKALLKNRCHIAGTDDRPIGALVDLPRTENYLLDVQEEIFRRVAMIERAMELSGLSIAA
ncbi:hypothetical protein [Dickeya chrysanthemi]|uniref:hypothetical protein n=1 Tax=Dickeya chrysanthemi TaxID=556 RepID=UPI003016F5C4